MKFYIHCEEPEITVVTVWENKKPGTVEDLIKTFLGSLGEKHPWLRGKCEHCIIRNNRGKIFSSGSQVCDVVKHMDDLFIQLNLAEDKSNEGQKRPQDKSEENNLKTDSIIQKSNAAIIHVGNGRFRKAIEIYKDMLQVDPKNKSALSGLTTCYKRADRYEKTLSWARKALKLFQNDVGFNLAAAEAHIKCGDGDTAIELLMSCSKKARMSGGMTTEEKHNVQVLLAKAYLLKDQKDMAITVLQGVLREDIDHRESLIEYASLLFPLGPSQSEEAMSILLTSLARDKHNKYAKEKFANICRQTHGMEVLKQVAGPALRDSSALVFLGNCLRDCSAIEEALELFSMALDADPSNPSIALIYVHTLEVVGRHTDILKFYKKYCRKFPKQSVGKLTLENINEILQSIPDSMSIEGDRTYHSNFETPSALLREYTDNEKYLLAFLFTLVKVLFIKGQLQFIPVIIHKLQPLYEGRDLHLSNIRNEAAYFGCISELFKTFEEIPSIQPLPEEKYIYFIGDSHCIPPAWQKLTVQDSAFIVYPFLSTGTKIWHLRSDGNFYPKVGFNCAVKNIPDNAEVIVCLGEIDCREALLKCWEKARYDTIEDGMEAVINIYLQVLKGLQSQHQWKIFIHPVVPVLDITRPIVLQFNRILATKLLSEPSIHWLNFVKQLLIGPIDGEMLKEEFRLDGTHLHPRYVSLLSESLLQYSSIL